MSTDPSLGARLLSLVLALLMPLDTAPIIYFFLTRNLSASQDRQVTYKPGASKQGNSVARAFALAADPLSLGRLSRQLTNTGGQVATLSMGYDPLGRVSAVTNPLGTFNVNYVDATQKVASVNYPNGQTTSYSYYPDVAASGTGNGDERLQQIQNLGPGGQTLSQFNYGYDPLGRITTWQRQLGSHPADKLTLSYDAGDQLVAAAKSDVATGNPLSVNAYAYDAAGNRTGTELDTAGTSTVTSFTANNTNEISGGAAGGPMRVEGNLTQYATVTVNGQPATTDASNHFVGSATVQPGANTITVTATNPNSLVKSKSYTVTAAGGSNQTFSYDLNGNLTSDAGHTYQWDAANRLVTINYTGTANFAQFAYDGQGRRVGITETSNGTVTSQKSLFWEGAAISRETDSVTGETRQFPGGGEIINGTPYFGTADHLSSTRELTDATGAVHAEYDYDPYGVATKLSGDTDARFQYAGYYQHAASGNALTLFRAYNPAAGRWLSRDPLGEAGGLNLYGYVGNDPVGASDPLGLISSLNTPEGAAAVAFWNSVATGAIVAAALTPAAANAPGPGDKIYLPYCDLEGTNPVENAVNGALGGAVGYLARVGAKWIWNEVSPTIESVLGKVFPEAAETGGEASVVARRGLLPAQCFPAGTKVSTPDGDVNIEDIKVGDIIYAYDLEKGETVERHVTELFRNFTYHWVDVQFDLEVVRATRSHPFWVESESQWVEAIDLKVGMVVRLANGTAATITNVSTVDLQQPQPTYNMEVAVNHDYFVGCLHVLVHNGNGSYTITFASGKKYVGKGDLARMETSAARIIAETGDKVVNTEWTPANGTADSFVQEEMRMRAAGGPGANTYNRINSPGNNIAGFNGCP